MAKLRLSFLGAPLIAVDGASVDLRPRKVLALLACLAVTAERHSRDSLAELLYPRQGRERARAGLRQCLSILRRCVGETWIGVDKDYVWLAPRKGLWTDLEEVRRAAGNRAERQDSSDIAGMVRLLDRTEQLFRGDFLSGLFLRDSADFESWQRTLAESLRDEHARLLEELVALHVRQENHGQALICARKWLLLDPTDEAAHRSLMRLYVLAGKRTEALHQYERCRDVLQKELRSVPDRETDRLREQIAKGEPLFPEKSGVPSVNSPLPHVPAGTGLTPPNNLRPLPTSFIGRETELEAVVGALRRPEMRLLTLTGPAGTGKTRLALQAARDTLPTFAHGTYLVDLSVLREPTQVFPTIAAALGIQAARGESLDPFDLVRSFLAGRRVMLLLDNFEHLLAAAEHVARLIADCPGLTILATSREALGLRAENEYLVPPLRLPGPGDPVDVLAQNEAVQLFIQRAGASHFGFALSGENAGAISEICVRLDGLPLAIELAAARTRFLPFQRMLRLLERRLDLLTGGPKDLPVRQQTLRRTIAWSYDLLDPGDRALFGRLAVFMGGFTFESADAVCRLNAEEDILRGLESLAGKGLLSRAGPDENPRFSMLETIHEFASERLEESGEAAGIRRAHMTHFLDMAEAAEPGFDTAGGAESIKRFGGELNNFRAALAWSIEHSVDEGLRLAAALQRFWYTQSHCREGVDWLKKVLEKSGDPSARDRDRWRAKALSAVCNGTLTPQSAAASVAAGEESVALWRKVGDTRGLARALLHLSLARMYESRDAAPVRALLDESASLLREAGDPFILVETVFWLGFMACITRQHENAMQITEECIRLANEAGDVVRVAGGAGLLGLIAAETGDYPTARSKVEESLRLYRQTTDNIGLFYQLSSLGALAYLQGDLDRVQSLYAEAFEKIPEGDSLRRVLSSLSVGFVSMRQKRWKRARTAFAEGIAYLRRSDTPWGSQCIAACVVGQAGIELGRGHADLAGKLLGATESLITAPCARLAWGIHLGATPTLIRKEYDRMGAEVRDTMGETALAAVAEGRALSLEEAVHIALAHAEHAGMR